MTEPITTPVTDFSELTIRYTRRDERHLPMFSHSIVEGILTCPVWGIIRYVKNLYYPINRRQLPLEAGSTMHEVFAAVRLWQLLRIQNLPDHFQHHGKRLFGADRLASSFKPILDNPRDELINFCYNILNSGDYYDDPDDTTRTLANMELTTIRYVDDRLPTMERNPIWVEDINDPTKQVGIEIVFDVIVTVGKQEIRFIGTIDGITRPDFADGGFVLDENKTASRLDEAFRKSYMVKQQPTGYLAIAKLITGLDSDQFRILGVKVKQTRSAEDILIFLESRTDMQIIDWARTLTFAKEIVDRYGDNPLTAPQFTHSCSRYFRPCAFIDLCGAEPEDRESILSKMVPAPLTPTQQALQEL